MEIRIRSATLALLEGDITRFAADAIVNAANSQLIGGGGVDGAIHRAGGPAIMQELDAMRPPGGCPTGSAVVTGAGRLAARHVIHAVGPVYRDGHHGEPDLLASCYHTSLALAAENADKTVAFPSISTGVYGYPLEEAARIAIRTIAEFLGQPGGSIERVTLVLFGRAAFEAHRRALDEHVSGETGRS
jgi:O-acetyl-ADP-ribose deacetylase (regulator of RNase III)